MRYKEYWDFTKVGQIHIAYGGILITKIWEGYN